MWIHEKRRALYLNHQQGKYMQILNVGDITLIVLAIVIAFWVWMITTKG